MKNKVQKFRQFLKFAVVVICVTGFLLQTHEFLELYWTYPTVVDIQVSVPSEIELPAISFCNTDGINPSVICEEEGFCMDPEKFRKANFCQTFSDVCDGYGTTSKPFQIVTYHKYIEHANFNASQLHRLRKRVSEFLTCKIISAGNSRNCNLTSILGSYYSDTNMFNFCYTINSLWSNPKSKVLKIKKSERVELKFHIDISDGNDNRLKDELDFPTYNYPSNPGVQLGIHSPYVSISPYIDGYGFLAGKRYQINLDQDEKHLLPPPYQTNCTDYMKTWKARGGIGPLNQMMVVEECKFNRSLQEMGCVPFAVDYPHNETVCKYCKDCNELTTIRDECTKQLQDYNQPCDSLSFDMRIKEKLVSLERKFISRHLRINETILHKRKGHDCSGHLLWSKMCQTVTIEIVFDDFQVTNLTYNPKFESIELFSVIGGYLGMYLGVSIVALYDLAEVFVKITYQFFKKRRAEKKKERAERRKAEKHRRQRILYSNGYRSSVFSRMR